jgi:hypothetical protein
LAAPPRWARYLDFLCLALVIVALIISVSGGFRIRFGGVRFALTSPYRTLIWAAALAVLRHLLAPGAPIYRDLPARIAAACKTDAVRVAAKAFVGTRLAVLLVGYLAIFTIGYREGGAPWKLVADNEFLNLQARWDAGWYLTVAIEGYSWNPNRPLDQQNIVFFPAFPLLMRVSGRLLGGTSTAYSVAGTVISLAAFLGALVYLFRLARDLLGSEDKAGASVWLIATFPFALFFSALYTESLFLLGAVATFYHFHRREYARAGAWGLLIGLTRPPGCFVSVPLAILAIEPLLPAWLAGGRREPAAAGAFQDRAGGADQPSSNLRRSADGSAAAEPLARPDSGGARQDGNRNAPALVPAIAAAAMPGVGMLLYSAFIWYLTGNPLEWARGHAAWGREYTGLGVLVAQRYEWLTQGGLYAYTSQVPGDFLNAIGPIFVLAAAWPVARRLGLAYAVFILLNILPPMAAGGLLSAGRFASVIFPAFIWFASAIPAGHRSAWQASFMGVQALNAILFYTWRPLY